MVDLCIAKKVEMFIQNSRENPNKHEKRHPNKKLNVI